MIGDRVYSSKDEKQRDKKKSNGEEQTYTERGYTRIVLSKSISGGKYFFSKLFLVKKLIFFFKNNFL